MKKFYNCIAVAAAVLGLSCCTDKLTTEVTPGATPGGDETLYEVQLGAAIGTKTTMENDGDVIWSTGDQISVKIGDGTAARIFTVVAGGSTSATFTGLVSADEKASIEAGTAELSATYPASGAEVPETQTFKDGSFADGMSPMTGKGSGTSLTFDNIASIVMAEDVNVGTATSAVLNYTVDGAATSKTISNISGVTEADLLFVVEAGAEAESFTLTLDGSSFAHRHYTSAKTVAGARYKLHPYVCKIDETQYKTLADAVVAVPADKILKTVTMLSDVVYDDCASPGYCVQIGANQNVALDLKGKVITLERTANESEHIIENLGTLTIDDSSTGGQMSVNYSSEADPQFVTSGPVSTKGNFTLEGGTLYSGCLKASYAVDCLAGTFTMNGGTLNSTYGGFRAYCQAGNVTVNINGGDVYGSHAIMIQNTEGSNTLKVYVKGGNITSTAYTGRTAKTAAYLWTGGDAQNANTSFEITGGYFKGGKYTEGGTESDVLFYGDLSGNLSDVIIVKGGYFSGLDCNESGAVQLSSLVASGCKVTANTDASTSGTYPWTVIENPNVARIGEVEYLTLQAAFDATSAGTPATITVIKDIDLGDICTVPVRYYNGSDTLVTPEKGLYIPAGRNIVLDLAGHKISAQRSAVEKVSLLHNYMSELEITGEGELYMNSTSNDPNWTTYVATITNEGVTTITNGNIHIDGGDGMSYAVDSRQNGRSAETLLTVNGGTLTASNYRAIRIFANGTPGLDRCVINGGTITGRTAGIWLQDPSDKANKADLTITGGTITATDSDRHGVHIEGNSPSADVTMIEASISGGTIKDVFVENVNALTKFITGGTYSLEPASAYIATGYKATQTGDVWIVESNNWKDHAATSFSQASGTDITIMNAAELALFAKNVNADVNYTGYTVKLGADIDLSGYQWDPIMLDEGCATNLTFDGDGKTISGLTMTRDESNTGLFGTYFSHGTVIKNLTISNPQITQTLNADPAKASDEIGLNYTAALAAHIGCGNVQNCTVTGGTINGQDQVGGIVGYLACGTVNGCTVSGTTINADVCRVGGIAGKVNTDSEYAVTNNTVSNLTVKADEKTDGMLSAGALVGQIMTGSSWEISGNTITGVTTTTGTDGTFVPVGEFRSGSFKADAVSGGHIIDNIWGNVGDSYTMVNPSDTSESVTIYSGKSQNLSGNINSLGAWR